MPDSNEPRTLVIGCGALAREMLTLIDRHGLTGLVVECLPAILHNRPERIPAAVEERIERAKGRYENIFVAYADCGTGGLLDKVLEKHGVERLDGAHCYQFFAGSQDFAALHAEDPGTLYLTDYLARHFERLLWIGLGLDRHPELRDEYFRNYNRVVYLAQTDDPLLEARAREAAERLDLAFELRFVGYGELEDALASLRGGSES